MLHTYKYKLFIIFGALLSFHVFFSFYNLEKWASFDWDQIDNAWASIHILLEHKLPLIGMAAKGNSGMYIGPLYYYLVSFFYYLTHLDPIASPLLAGFTRIFSFIILIIYTKRLFNEKVALMSGFIYTWSSYIIHAERSQWPVNFIAPLSIMILYYLFEITKNKPKYFIHLAVLIGLSFHLHFTAVFYVLLCILVIPIIPMNKTTWKYIALSACTGLLFFIPQLMYYAQQSSNLHAYTSYFQTYYHGFHLTRILQLQHDAFIKFQSILEISYPRIKDFVIVIPPLFFLIFLKSRYTRDSLKLCYLIALWFIVPWLLFSAYRGEISDYYFSITLYVAIVILAYISIWIWGRKNILFRTGIVLFWIYYGLINFQTFFHTPDTNLSKNRRTVQKVIEAGTFINFSEGDPQSYLFFYYTYTKTKRQPY